MDWFPLYNSIRIAAISTVIIFFVGIFAAYYIAKTPRLVKGVLDVILTLTLEVPEVPAGTKAVGVRMHDIRHGSGKNSFRCRVVGEIENPFSYTVMLRASPAAAPMGWEMSKERWQTLRTKEVEVCLPPEALLLLKDKNSEVMK